jgi:hypothetical protein
MVAKTNPLKLNPLQLRTLTLLQALAALPDAIEQGPGEGEITIKAFPRAHADHFHLGEAVVSGHDATGLFNQAVWHALTRKGLALSQGPESITLTAAGLSYETGLADAILRHSGH